MSFSIVVHRRRKVLRIIVGITVSVLVLVPASVLLVYRVSRAYNSTYTLNSDSKVTTSPTTGDSGMYGVNILSASILQFELLRTFLH
jgi:hypothetical protein